MQAEVLLRTVQPEVTCGGQVKDQPAFLCRPQFSLFQQQRLQVAEDETATVNHSKSETSVLSLIKHRGKFTEIYFKI